MCVCTERDYVNKLDQILTFIPVLCTPERIPGMLSMRPVSTKLSGRNGRRMWSPSCGHPKAYILAAYGGAACLYLTFMALIYYWWCGGLSHVHCNLTLLARDSATDWLWESLWELIMQLRGMSDLLIG